MRKIGMYFAFIAIIVALYACSDSYSPLEDPLIQFNDTVEKLNNSNQFEFDFSYTISLDSAGIVDSTFGSISYNLREDVDYFLVKEHDGVLFPEHMEYAARVSNNLVNLFYDYSDYLIDYKVRFLPNEFKHDIQPIIAPFFDSALLDEISYDNARKYTATLKEGYITDLVPFFLPNVTIKSFNSPIYYFTFNKDKIERFILELNVSDDVNDYTIKATVELKKLGSAVTVALPSLKEVALKQNTVLYLSEMISEVVQAYRQRETSAYDYSFVSQTTYPGKEPYGLFLFGETQRRNTEDFTYFSNYITLQSDYKGVYAAYGVKDLTYMRLAYASMQIYDCLEGPPKSQEVILEQDYSNEQYLRDSFYLLPTWEFINYNNMSFIKIIENEDKSTTYQIMLSYEGIVKLIDFYNKSVLLSKQYEISLLSTKDLVVKEGYINITLKNNTFTQLSFYYNYSATHSLYQANNPQTVDFLIEGNIITSNAAENYEIPRGINDVVFPRRP